MAQKVQYRKSVFQNGLTLISERVSGLRGLSIGVWVKIGTRQETPKVAGVSHYLEHMLFKGTKDRSAFQIAKEIDQVGGEFNAFTSREHTCFHILLLDQDYSLGLDILSDIILNSDFKDDEFERERKVILQEISMVDESPEELAHDLFFEIVYKSNGLGRPILGTQRSIRKMTRAQMVKFFRQHYRPEELVVAAVGDVDHDSIVRKLKPLTSHRWPGRGSRARSGRAGRKAISDLSRQHQGSGSASSYSGLHSGLHSGVWSIERPTEQIHLIWGTPAPNYSSKDRSAAFLLNVSLGGGMSSALFQEIREKNGLAYSVYSSLSPFTDSGVFTIYCATRMQDVEVCLKLIESCIAQIKKKDLPLSELRTVQNNLKGTILLSSDNVESRMSRIAINEIFLGKYISVNEICRGIDQVTSSHLRRLANSMFRDDQRGILTLGPKLSKSVATKLRPVVLRRYCRT